MQRGTPRESDTASRRGEVSVLVEPVKCCCTVGHITACCSRHNNDCLLALRRLGPKSDHEKTARIIHCAQRIFTRMCVCFPLFHGSGAGYPGIVVLIYSWYLDIVW